MSHIASLHTQLISGCTIDVDRIICSDLRIPTRIILDFERNAIDKNVEEQGQCLREGLKTTKSLKYKNLLEEKREPYINHANKEICLTYLVAELNILL